MRVVNKVVFGAEVSEDSLCASCQFCFHSLSPPQNDFLSMSAGSSHEPTAILSQDGSTVVALVFLPADHLERETAQQIRAMAQHPSVAHVRVMPDCHKGSGCCVGFTAQITKLCACPQLIGGDIGCGVSAHPVPPCIMSRKNALDRINRAIHSCVPMGGSLHADPVISVEQLEPFMESATAEWHTFCDKYRSAFGVDLRSGLPESEQQQLTSSWLEKRTHELGIPFHRVMCSLCTLGSGNHFIELDEASSDASSSPSMPQHLLVVHSGSRSLGQAIYKFWVTSRRRQREAALTKAPSSTALDTNGGAPPDVPLTAADINDDNDDDNEAASSNFAGDINLVSVTDVAAYYRDMIVAQKLAELNRLAMLSAVMHAVARQDDEDVFSPSSMISSVHNYIDFEDLVVRKGAIPARPASLGIVALNMRDGVLLVRGRGNLEWNQSAAHGCGRLAPRGGAASQQGRSSKDAQFALKKFRDEMKDVLSDCIQLGTLDERPSAYRDPSIVRTMLESCAGGAVDVLAHYKTLVNAKGF